MLELHFIVICSPLLEYVNYLLSKKLITINTTFSALTKSYLLEAFNKFIYLGRPENFIRYMYEITGDKYEKFYLVFIFMIVACGGGGGQMHQALDTLNLLTILLQ